MAKSKTTLNLSDSLDEDRVSALTFDKAVLEEAYEVAMARVDVIQKHLKDSNLTAEKTAILIDELERIENGFSNVTQLIGEHTAQMEDVDHE